MGNKIQKRISVELSEKEVVNISRCVFENHKNYISIINWQLEMLHGEGFLNTKDLDTIRELVDKTYKKL